MFGHVCSVITEMAIMGNDRWVAILFPSSSNIKSMNENELRYMKASG